MPEEYEQLSGMSSRGKKTSGKGKFGETDVEDENEEDGDDDGVYVEFRRK
jgi:phosphate-selective porin